MNWNSPLGISIYLAFATGVLSVSQAWVLGSLATRWARYLIALIGSALLLALAGGMVLDAWSGQGRTHDTMRVALFISGLVIAALGFWVGGLRRGARATQESTLMGRAGVLYGTHFAVVFFGSAIALLVIALVGLSQANW
jgi:hypothetical protein